MRRYNLIIALTVLVLSAGTPIGATCTDCPTKVTCAGIGTSLQCLQAERAAFQEQLQTAGPAEKPFLAGCIKKINEAIADLDAQKEGCLAARLGIEVVGPLEGGKVVFQRIGRKQIGDAEQGRGSIAMRLVNKTAGPLTVTKIRIHGQDVSTFDPKTIAANATIAFQNCNCKGESKPLILDEPFPQTVKIEVLLQGEMTPVAKTISIVPHTNDEGPLRYPGKVSDLRPNETWGASSNHRAGHQVFALDTGILGWNGKDGWSNTFPGTDGTLKEHYRVYGMPVYAMTDGTVCWALNDHEERPTIAEAVTTSPSQGSFRKGGNQLYIKAGNEISVIAHLQPGSIPPELLKIGAPVKRGQYLGKVGLSGQTSHPHTHIHVKVEPEGGAPMLGTHGNSCGKGQYRPMTFNSLQSLTKTEATTLAQQSQLDASDWMVLTNHSAPHSDALLFPTSAPYEFCKTCSQSSQYIGVWRTGSQIDLRVKAADWKAFTDKWAELSKDSFRLVEIDTFPEDGQLRFFGLFQRGGGKHFLWNVAGWAKFTGKWKELSEGGYRLIDLDTYELDGERYYIGVFREGSGGHFLWSITGWDAFTQKWDELSKSGLRLIDIESFPIAGNQRQYIGIFRAGTGGYGLWSITGWDAFIKHWSEVSKSGVRLIDIETFPVGTARQFVGVYRAGTGGYALESQTGYDRFVQASERNSSQGLRLVDVHVEQ